MNSLAYSHGKFESIIVHLVFNTICFLFPNIFLYLPLPVNCGEHLLIFVLQYMDCWKSQYMTNLMCNILFVNNDC